MNDESSFQSGNGTGSQPPSPRKKAYRGVKKSKRKPRVRPPGSPPLKAGDDVTELELILDHTVRRVEQHGSVPEAAQSLDVTARTIKRRLEEHQRSYIQYPRSVPPEKRRAPSPPDHAAGSTDD